MHRGSLGSSGTRVKTAFLYSYSCDVRKQGPLHPLVTKSQSKLPQRMPKPWRALPCLITNQQRWSYALTLGILANRPARVSRMLVISKISISYNRVKTRKMKKDKEGNKSITEPPEAAKQVSSSACHWGRALPPGTRKTGECQLLTHQAGGLASAEAMVVVCNTILFRVRPEAQCG